MIGNDGSASVFQCVADVSIISRLLSQHISTSVMAYSAVAGGPPSNGAHLIAYGSTNCTGTSLLMLPLNFIASAEDPTQAGTFELLNQILPVTTVSIKFELLAVNNQDHIFDHAYLAPEIVFFDGFEN